MAILCRPTIQLTSRDKLEQAGCQPVRKSHCHGLILWENVAMNHFNQSLMTDGVRCERLVEDCVKITQKAAFLRPCWLADEKIIGRVHFVYHIHLCAEKSG
jgi:hypothetical protein